MKCSFWWISGFLLFWHWSCVLFSSVCEAPDPSWECVHKRSADLRWHVGYIWLFCLDLPSPPSTATTFFYYFIIITFFFWSDSSIKMKLIMVSAGGNRRCCDTTWGILVNSVHDQENGWPLYVFMRDCLPFTLHLSLQSTSIQFWTTGFLMLLISSPADIN